MSEFTNPGRGWYYHLSTTTTNYEPLSYASLMQLRNDSAGYTLIFRFIVLDSFKSQPIDNATLQSITDDFAMARRAFFKLILRFAYTRTFHDPPPRGDAPKSVILQHISQLAPILRANADIILTVQHGFIGTWGEGYYTDYFGDSGIITPQQQQDRQEVYDALINGVPECVMIQVRTWQFKSSLTGTSLPVTSDKAHTCGNSSNAIEARTGLHDDCFLASETDFGTWLVSAVDKPRMSGQSQFAVFGGETCNPGSERNACPTALQELSLFHFTFLNNLYHPDVLNRWRSEGCYSDIAQRLGYRLVLVSSRFPSQAMVGSEINFDITLRNDGFAAPMTQMMLRLVLQEFGGNISRSFEFSGSNTDPRFWFGNGTEHLVSGMIMIPSDMGAGVWNIYLAIVDAADTLRDIPQYNILAVNQDSSMKNSGLNNLSRSITIAPSSSTTTESVTSTTTGSQSITSTTESGIDTTTDSQSITVTSTESGIYTATDSQSSTTESTIISTDFTESTVIDTQATTIAFTAESEINTTTDSGAIAIHDQFLLITFVLLSLLFSSIV